MAAPGSWQRRSLIRLSPLCYDKRASGPHAVENVDKLFGKVSVQSYLNELVAAAAVLARQDRVDRSADALVLEGREVPQWLGEPRCQPPLRRRA